MAADDSCDPGAAGLTLNEGQGEVCLDLSGEQVGGTVFAAHIHVSDAGVAGPVVVPVFSGAFAGSDATAGCISGVDADLIKAIRQNQSAYYVNVHSSDFPAGAVRGQLGE